MTSRIVLITDTHLTPAGKRYHNTDPWAIFSTALERIVELRPSAVVHLGDIASRPGSAEVYRTFLHTVEESGRRCPWHLVPGNHDDVLAMESVFPLRPGNGIVLHRTVSSVTLGGIRIVFVPDGCAVTAAVRRAFRHPQPLLAVTHRHLYPVGVDWIDSTIHPHRTGLLQLLSDRKSAGRASIVAYGHVHRWQTFDAGGAPSRDSRAAVVSLDSLSTRFDMEADSWAVSEPAPSVALVEYVPETGTFTTTRIALSVPHRV